MNDIRIISASAGSGKTHRIAELLSEEIGSGRVRPEAVVATTFTKKAAAELVERVRIRLLSDGRAEEAQRLDAALIGTVNSICGRLVAGFAFDLRVSPAMSVLDEAGAKAAFESALGASIAAAEEAELGELCGRMPDFDWQEMVRRVADAARVNAIDGAALRGSAAASAEECLDLARASSEPDEPTLDSRLIAALDAFIAAAAAAMAKGDETAATEAAEKQARQARDALRDGRSLPWKDWHALATKLKPAAALKAAAAGVGSVASGHYRHPLFRSDLRRSVELVFGLAAKSLDAYQEAKRAMGAIDFIDQELLALRILSDAKLRSRLEGGIDIVLVDEFQDTSPIQLALFLKLAALAGKSVWVGDQKQAIYGFRGADPALMDAAIAALVGDGEPETLGFSYRSRPALVQLVSAAFAPPFEARGIPSSRTKLVPSLGVEPPGLGAALEYWRLDSSKKDDDAACLAAGVLALLGENAQVRDRESGEPRALEPRDVALLCRTNDECATLAASLKKLGIDASFARPGLASSLEARLALAGLALWLEPLDSLAAAEIARLTWPEGEEDGWLSAILAKPGMGAFAGYEPIASLLAARGASASGLVEAFDAVVDILQVRERCAAWGDAEERLAKLEDLRAWSCRYICARATGSGAATIQGFLAQVAEYAEEGEDKTSGEGGRGAVTVSTWHGAKGLEWPVVVLAPYSAGRSADRLAFGVAIEGREKPDLAGEVLAGRRVRFCPDPYHPQNKDSAYHKNLAASQRNLAARERADYEELRLLYVAWTRARDRLVIASREAAFGGAMLEGLVGAGDSGFDEANASATILGVTLPAKTRSLAPVPAATKPRVPEERYVVVPGRDHPPAYIQPSAIRGQAAEGARLERLGPPLPIREGLDRAALGTALHAFYCASAYEPSEARRRVIAERVFRAYGFEGEVDIDAMCETYSRLDAWLEARWPGAARRAEVPVLWRREDGAVVRGVMDLVVESGDSVAILDHKTYSGTEQEVIEKAKEALAQLRLYENAMKHVVFPSSIGCFVFLPLEGLLLMK